MAQRTFITARVARVDPQLAESFALAAQLDGL
jgi:hypothetical protein